MTKRRILTVSAGVFVAMLMVMAVQAGDLPPAGSKALSGIVQTAEKTGLGTITEAEFEDGQWKIEFHKGDQKLVQYIDPKSGEALRKAESTVPLEALPPQGSLALSKIVASVESRKLGTIHEIDFDDGQWEVEIWNGTNKVEVHIDAVTGKDVVVK